MRAFLNPAVDRTHAFRGFFADDEYRDVHAFYAAGRERDRSPLRTLPKLAAASGIEHLDAKDESHRFGLNAFKIVGVRYAAHRIGDRGLRPGVVCATAGNHGRAVARLARERSVPCTVFVPVGRNLSETETRTRTSRMTGMKEDGATVIEVDGGYEEAVSLAARHGRDTGAMIVSDTSWTGYEQIPRWIMAGYTWILEEASSQWTVQPEVVLIQGGVGGLVCAAANWFAWRFGAARPFLVACEPENAACLLESARAGRPVRLSGDLTTIMAGLRCAEPSPAALPAILHGIDAFVTVSDTEVIAAVTALADAPPAQRIAAGPSGACGAAALMALGSAPELSAVRDACALDRSTRALIVVTEGA